MDTAIDWKATFDSFPDIIFLVDAQRCITWMNAAACKTFQLSLEDALGRSLEALVEDPGKGRVFEVTTCPLHDASGSMVGALCCAQDSTVRRRTEEALQESEKRYRELVDAIQEGLGIVDEHEVIQFCNPALARIFEVPVTDLVGRNLRDFVDEGSWQEIQGQTAVRKTSCESVYELTIRTGQGNRRQLKVYASARFDAKGNYLGAFGLVQDITERKESERVSEQLLHELSCIYSISQAIETHDSLPDLLEEVARLIVPGTETPEETYAGIVLDGQLFEVSPEKHDSNHTLEAPILIEGKTRGEVQISRNDAYPFTSEERRLLTRIAESVQRVVLRKELQAKLLFAQKMESIGTLAGGIAHDFNNLMVGVLGSVILLRDRLGPKSGADALLSTIEESATRAGILARQLLTYARGGDSQPQLINLNESVQNVLRLQEKILSPHAHIDYDLDPDLARIEADPAQIQQVVLNLCVNAAEAMPHGGSIRLKTRNREVDAAFARSHADLTSGSYVSLTIQDSGFGMNSETLARMFEPFFTTKSQGRGLGLAVVYGIVKSHKGHIAVESEVGKGTKIRVLLPAVRRAAPPAPKPKARERRGTETILLIDDETIVLDITKQLLEKLGFRVLTAHNGKEAVYIAENYEGAIEVALLDLGMPVMDGFEAFPVLQKRRPDMKILVCSGYAPNGPAQELLHAGAVGFIQKPFYLDTLCEAIRAALDGKSPQ
jgi:PAS domain S-box-containing protein